MAQRIEAVAGTRPAAQTDFLAGMLLALPIVLSVVLYGLLLGALASQAGLRPFEVVLMSALVFGGASQFVAVELWTTPVAFGAVVFATFLVNLRHTLMSATIEPGFRRVSSARAYTALFFMVDEAWALSLPRIAEGRFTMAFYAGLVAPLYLAWLASTGAGAVVGGFVQDPARYGLDVVFTAVFVVLLKGLWGGRGSLLPWAVAAAAAVACQHWIPGAWYIFAGGLAGVFAAAATWRPDHER